jgi:hypothetical protein
MGRRLWLATAVIAVLGLASMLIFASVSVWISGAIFLALIAASIPLNAVILSRTEKD